MFELQNFKVSEVSETLKVSAAREISVSFWKYPKVSEKLPKVSNLRKLTVTVTENSIIILR
eukprot:UN12438